MNPLETGARLFWKPVAAGWTARKVWKSPERLIVRTLLRLVCDTAAVRGLDAASSSPERIRRWGIIVVAGVCLWVTGCATTRSISNSSATDARAHTYASRGSSDIGFEYRGELNEFDVLGVDRSRTATEDEIAQALERARAVELKAGSRVMLVQSGAVFPDGPMVTEMSKHFSVVPFSGVPPKRHTATDVEPSEAFSYSKGLRLAAARAGAESIVCYWGTLESARRRMETKTVSWVPIAGWMVPDESQHMRIRLKLAVIDVRTGSWRVLSPEPFMDKSWSTAFTRGSSDLKQVEALKAKAYVAGVKLLAGKPGETGAIE